MNFFLGFKRLREATLGKEGGGWLKEDLYLKIKQY